MSELVSSFVNSLSHADKARYERELLIRQLNRQKSLNYQPVFAKHGIEDYDRQVKQDLWAEIWQPVIEELSLSLSLIAEETGIPAVVIVHMVAGHLIPTEDSHRTTMTEYLKQVDANFNIFGPDKLAELEVLANGKTRSSSRVAAA